MGISHTTDQTFKKDIQSGLTLVDFWVPWCGPCRMIAPVLDELDQEMGGEAKITKLNVDENPATARAFGVMSIPTLILFKDGKPIDTVTGVQSKNALKEMISKHK
ncbi:thioredoxin [Paenibacillus terrae]|uniref:thioredoxin n=1 Tax=Paenibacillus terrae TaxID=159743 RepID=UPI0011EB2D0D|nr:thioredoxin [Paenibacillus terrae]